MKTFIYRLTHLGDPNVDGLWGYCGCEGHFLNGTYDAVIGLGGWSHKTKALRTKVAWIGLEPEKIGKLRGYDVHRLEHLLLLTDQDVAVPPELFKKMFAVQRRSPLPHKHGHDPELDRELNKLLRLAENAPASKWGRPK